MHTLRCDCRRGARCGVGLLEDALEESASCIDVADEGCCVDGRLVWRAREGGREREIECTLEMDLRGARAASMAPTMAAARMGHSSAREIE